MVVDLEADAERFLAAYHLLGQTQHLPVIMVTEDPVPGAAAPRATPGVHWLPRSFSDARLLEVLAGAFAPAAG